MNGRHKLTTESTEGLSEVLEGRTERLVREARKTGTHEVRKRLVEGLSVCQEVM